MAFVPACSDLEFPRQVAEVQAVLGRGIHDRVKRRDRTSHAVHAAVDEHSNRLWPSGHYLGQRHIDESTCLHGSVLLYTSTIERGEVVILARPQRHDVMHMASTIIARSER